MHQPPEEAFGSSLNVFVVATGTAEQNHGPWDFILHSAPLMVLHLIYVLFIYLYLYLYLFISFLLKVIRGEDRKGETCKVAITCDSALDSEIWQTNLCSLHPHCRCGK